MAAAVARICDDGHHAGAADTGDPHGEAAGSNDAGGLAGGRTGAARRRVPGPRRGPGVTLRKDGQSPDRQEKSRLQEDWLIRVLRPNSVATGCTDRQLDLAPQSPQPSQTRSLMNTRWAGGCALPRRRLRRFSAAHSWSWISTVTPVDRRQFPLHVEQVVPVPDVASRRPSWRAQPRPGRRW